MLDGLSKTHASELRLPRLPRRLPLFLQEALSETEGANRKVGLVLRASIFAPLTNEYATTIGFSIPDTTLGTEYASLLTH